MFSMNCDVFNDILKFRYLVRTSYNLSCPFPQLTESFTTNPPITVHWKHR